MPNDLVSHASRGLRIVDLEDRHLTAVLAALTEAFGSGFDDGWYRWKHMSNPMGRSLGWIAEDDAGLLGVRLFLRWTFDAPAEPLVALRPCDTVTVARARGRGVFTALTKHAISAVGQSADLLFNTPNKRSVHGYHAMGFKEWTLVRQYAHVVAPRPARLTALEDNRPDGRLASDKRSAQFLSWRYASCPRHDYQLVMLDAADAATGLVYRMRPWRGLRLILVLDLWGPPRERRALLGAAAAREKASLAWLAVDDGRRPSLGVPAGSTLVTYLPINDRRLERPQLCLGDVEDVV